MSRYIAHSHGGNSFFYALLFALLLLLVLWVPETHAIKIEYDDTMPDVLVDPSLPLPTTASSSRVVSTTLSMLPEVAWRTAEEQSAWLDSWLQPPLISASLGTPPTPHQSDMEEVQGEDTDVQVTLNSFLPPPPLSVFYTASNKKGSNVFKLDANANANDNKNIVSDDFLKEFDDLLPANLEASQMTTPLTVRFARPQSAEVYGNPIVKRVIEVKDQKARIPITMYDSQIVLVVFEGEAGNTVSSVVQLKDSRYDSSVPNDNCYGMYLNVELRSKATEPVNAQASRTRYVDSASSSSSSSSYTGSTVSPTAAPDPYPADKGAWGAFWNSFAQMFDTSAFCELLPSLSLRIFKVQKTQPFYVIIRSTARYPTTEDPSMDNEHARHQQCQLEVFLNQKSAKKQQQSQIIFSLVIPLIVLFVPLPFLLRRADIIQAAMLDVDLSDWLWFPPYMMRSLIIKFFVYIFTAIRTRIVHHRMRAKQKKLEAQQQALSEEMNHAQAHFLARAQQQKSPTSTGVRSPGGTFLIPPPPQEKLDLIEASSKEHDHTTAVSMVSSSSNRSTVSVTLTRTPPAAREELETRRSDDSDSTVKCASKKDDDMEEPTKQQKPSGRTMLFTTGEDGEEEEEKFCRICRDGEEEAPLVAPCACTGSVRWVHRDCLDHWRLESAKRNMNNMNTCEICKKPFTIGISRAKLLWESSRQIINGVLLFFTCVVTMIAITTLSHSVFGELSCLADYHQVSYTSMFNFEGLTLSIFLYCLCLLLALFAYLVVFSWFRSRPEVEAYINDEHLFPPFFTKRNMVLMALVTIILVAQGISMGFLLKIFLYGTSDIVWTWEISPLVGGMLYLIFITFSLGVSNSIREAIVGRAGSAGAAEDVVIESATPAPAGASEETSNSGNSENSNNNNNNNNNDNNTSDGVSTRPVATFTEQTPVSQNVDYTQHFEIPPEQRVIRASEYCAPTVTRQREF